MSENTTLEDRLQIVALSEAGLTDRQIAEQTGWPIVTVRKWRRRAKRSGRAGLASRMGRPKQGALSTYSIELRDTLLRWRKAHPGWGPKTLLAELQKHPAFAGTGLPSASSIARFLREQHLTRPYEHHSDLPQTDPASTDEPHEVWEMDARGYSRVDDVGVVSLVHLNDCCSHARLLSFPVLLGQKRCQRYVTTDDYQAILRLAFTDWGLPEQLQVDRAPVFREPKSKSPFPRRLHLWLLALGVDLRFGRPHQPRDQGMTERSHQVWAAQVLEGQHYACWNDLYLALRQRRDFLNYDLPCASLDDQPPLQAFPRAVHSGRPYRPEWEAELLDLDRIWSYLAQGRWFRKTSNVATFSLGGQTYYIGQGWKHQQIEIMCDASDRHLVCFSDAGDLLCRLPIKGISKDALMGELAPYVNLPMFQLHLPFKWEDFRVIRLFDTIES
jgi:transposase